MPSFIELLRAVETREATRPRITWYDDSPGPTQGERIELSGRVIVNWANKAANALQEEFDVGPGIRVGLDLPPHWRTAYWALATWATGATVVLGPHGALDDTDVLVTSEAQTAAGHPAAILVALPALARSHPDEALAGDAFVETRSLSSFGDQFLPYAVPAPTDAALEFLGNDGKATVTAYRELMAATPIAGRVAVRTTTVETLLRDLVGVVTGGGSLVILHGFRDVSAVVATESVTLDRT